jgi:DNA replication protein DnaC
LLASPSLRRWVISTIEQVAAKYRDLRFNWIAADLPALLSQAEANELSYLQFAEQLADREVTRRERKRIEINRRKAGFPVVKALEELDDRHQSTLTKRQVNQLLDFSFIDERANLVFIGPPGVGKTHLAIGIGSQAIEAGYKALFTTALGWVETLEIAELKGELKRKISSLLKLDLLIIDSCEVPGYVELT